MFIEFFDTYYRKFQMYAKANNSEMDPNVQ